MPDSVIPDLITVPKDAQEVPPQEPLLHYECGITSPSTHPLNNLELLLLLFRLDPPASVGGIGKAEYFWKIVNLLWGEKSRSNKKVFRHPWGDRMIELACQHKYLGVHGAGSTGKCLAPNTPILMHDGSIKSAKEVRVGDRLMGDDSKPRNVLSTNSGRSNMVRIVPVKGDPWECNDDHMLTIKRMWAGKKSWRRVGEVQDISVKDYLSSSQTFRDHRGLYCVGVEFTNQPVEFDPQIYGIWLGDGGTRRPIIHSHDDEIEVNRFITSYFSGLGYNVAKAYYNNGRCASYMISSADKGWGKNAFRAFVEESSFGVGGKKRILPRYLFNSRSVRLKLLAGLIDSDGHAAGTSKVPPTYFEIACAYPELSGDIVFLARSLGYRVTVRKRLVKCNGKNCKSDRINIMGDFSDLPTLRKKVSQKLRRLNSDCTGFKIEQLGEGDWCGWTLDGNGRFLLGDFTVTHNTDAFSLWGIVNWMADPLNTMVLVTSTSLKDSRKRIWASITSYFQCVEGYEGVGTLVDSVGMIRSVMPDGSVGNDRCGIALIPGEKTKEKEAIGKMIGIKNEKVILIADELPELSEALMSAAQSNLALNPHFQMIGLGNFKSIYDPLGVFVTPKGGWSSVSVNDDEWETKDGYCLHLDGMRSPNVIAGEDLYPRIYNKKNLKEHQTKYGHNSPLLWRMCRSFPCPAGEEHCIYSEADFIKGNAHSKAEWIDLPVPVIGADPAFTNEGDEFAVCHSKFGRNKSGLPTLEVSEMESLIEDVALTAKGEARDLQTARLLAQAASSRGVAKHNLGVDCSGPGGLAFGSILSIFWGSNFLPVKFGEVASDMVISTEDPRKGFEAFNCLSTEIWFMGREFVRAGQIKGLPLDVAMQMKARHYETVKQGDFVKIKLESKKDMKMRVGYSPDKAEAFLICLYLCRYVFGFRPGEIQLAGMHRGKSNSSQQWLNKVRAAHSVYENAFTS